MVSNIFSNPEMRTCNIPWDLPSHSNPYKVCSTLKEYALRALFAQGKTANFTNNNLQEYMECPGRNLAKCINRSCSSESLFQLQTHVTKNLWHLKANLFWSITTAQTNTILRWLSEILLVFHSMVWTTSLRLRSEVSQPSRPQLSHIWLTKLALSAISVEV